MNIYVNWSNTNFVVQHLYRFSVSAYVLPVRTCGKIDYVLYHDNFCNSFYFSLVTNFDKIYSIREEIKKNMYVQPVNQSGGGHDSLLRLPPFSEIIDNISQLRQ